MDKIRIIVGLICGFIIFFLFAERVLPFDRCQEFVHDERIQHTKYFGLSYPWWNGVGQAKTESACRINVKAFDGGMGLTQFMPKTWAGVEKDMGVKLDPYNPLHSIRAQAFYMHQLHHQNTLPGVPLFATYQAYNGGWKLLKKEYQLAGSVNHDLMYLECNRKVLKLKSGRLLDLCDVNYEYSLRVWKFGNIYKPTDKIIDKWRYW